MKSLRPIFRYLKRHVRLIIVYFACNLLAILFSLVSLTMLIPFISLIFGKTNLVYHRPAMGFSVNGLIAGFNYFISQLIINHPDGKVFALGFICIVVVTAIFLKNLFLYIATYLNSPIRNAVINDIRSDLFSKVLSLPIGYFSEERKGDIISRMTNDLQEVETSIVSFLESFFREPFTVLISLVVMFKISPELTILVLVFLPLTTLVIGRISKSLRKNSNIGQEKLSSILTVIDETLGGMRVIKAFNAEKQQQLRFTVENNALFRIKNRINHKRDLASPLSEFMGVVVLCVVLFIGGRLALNHPDATTDTASEFIGFIAIFSQIINPLKSFSTAMYNIQKGRAGLDRIEKILNSQESIKDREDALPLQSFHREIVFRDAGFSYSGEKVLSGINLSIFKGKMIALVGSSGAGKSTLADLIPRFHDLTEGSLLIDGIDIREYRVADVRRLMGIVTQEPILFNDTIANNIALGAGRVNEEQIIAAAKVANAHDFIIRKEQGYQTNIGDRGVKLSGGEKQRITIARAVLKNPPILILDEATSSLDTESERIVQDAIYNLMQNRTSIVIAHRLSTIRHADQINVISDGKIAEQGKHDELMALGGVYRRLVDMQQFK
ncbi:MAG TPA: ABC transporter ATP-binding protein [Chitinophagaceae bacterium]|nr:ABC transporter ATP-binding protein [Chitinophagaceae bacterium]